MQCVSAPTGTGCVRQLDQALRSGLVWFHVTYDFIIITHQFVKDKGFSSLHCATSHIYAIREQKHGL